MITPSNNLSASHGLQIGFINQKSAGLNLNNSKINNTAYYAKKGEPMYMKEMDADDDGVVTLDEFKDYCQENDISPKEMVRMVEMANSYRTMKANDKASENVRNEEESNAQEIAEPVYAKRGDSKYDELMDTNNDDKVTYKEYIEYCKEHAKQQDKTSATKVEAAEDNKFKITDAQKALNTYSSSENGVIEGKFVNIV